MAKFKCSNFASSAISNLSLQKNRTMAQLPVSIMGIDFTEGCHVLFNRVVESLLYSLHERPVLLRKIFLLESQYCQMFLAPEHSSDLSVEVQA